MSPRTTGSSSRPQAPASPLSAGCSRGARLRYARRSMKIIAAGVLLAATVYAQTSETQLFRAVLLPANELPAINNTARAIADVTISVVRDSAGTLVNGT